jgi:hypothetical protein
MQLLTSDKGERAIQCDLFEETLPLKTNHLITITDDAGVKWYVLGESIQREDKWVVPLQIVDEADEAEARRTGTVGTFVVGDNGALA